MGSTLFQLSRFQVAITVLLAIVPFISATPSPPLKELRDPAVQERDSLPSGWSSLGCYTDSPEKRTLTAGGYPNPTGMSVEQCISICQYVRNTVYAGVENGVDCYCGNVLTSGAATAPASDCNTPCAGNSTETCGGSNSLNLYWNGHPPPPQPTIVQNVDNEWGVEACFNDSTTARTLSAQVSVQGGPYNNTVRNCLGACKAEYYLYAGLELAQQCWCGNSTMNYAVGIDPKNCDLACSGNSSEICGGADALVLYFYYVNDPS
ncbi:WSC domain-containing protein [Lactarius quietus]|nr:WSC domain-containing protein [Lactarius quietus]